MFRRKGNPPPASTHQRWSQHTGVSWRQQRGQWEAYCHYDGKKHHLGFFDDEKKAAEAYQKARMQHMKPNKRSSKYKGVSWWKADQKWRARIHYGGKAHHIGADEEDEDDEEYEEDSINKNYFNIEEYVPDPEWKDGDIYPVKGFP